MDLSALQGRDRPRMAGSRPIHGDDFTPLGVGLWDAADFDGMDEVYCWANGGHLYRLCQDEGGRRWCTAHTRSGKLVGLWRHKSQFA